MKAEDFLSDDFLKQFKTGKQLNGFLGQILNGFTQTIRTVFPQSSTQVCVVYQIRNSCRYVVWKDKKTFNQGMKDIYAAPTRQAAQVALDSFEAK